MKPPELMLWIADLLPEEYKQALDAVTLQGDDEFESNLREIFGISRVEEIGKRA